MCPEPGSLVPTRSLPRARLPCAHALCAQSPASSCPCTLCPAAPVPLQLARGLRGPCPARALPLELPSGCGLRADRPGPLCRGPSAEVPVSVWSLGSCTELSVSPSGKTGVGSPLGRYQCCRSHPHVAFQLSKPSAPAGRRTLKRDVVLHTSSGSRKCEQSRHRHSRYRVQR